MPSRLPVNEGERMLMLRVIPLMFLLLFTLLVREAACLDTTPQIGKTAPSFELPDINGKRYSLSDSKGKVILINFWATWCGPCKAEMPSLNNLFNTFKDEGFVVLAISVDSSAKPVQSFLKDKAIALPVLMDTEQDVYFDQYGVLGLPTSFLIDRDGIVRELIRGEREWDSPDMKDKVGKLLMRKKGDGK